MSLKQQICGCLAPQTSFYVQVTEPLSYKCLDYMDRSSSSVVRDISMLAKDASLPKHQMTSCKSTSGTHLLKCCATANETFTVFHPADASMTNTLMDTAFAEDESDLEISTEDSSHNTAFSEHSDSSCHTSDDDSQENTHSTCSSNGHLVPHKRCHKKPKASLAKTIKKITKHFH